MKVVVTAIVLATLVFTSTAEARCFRWYPGKIIASRWHNCRAYRNVTRTVTRTDSCQCKACQCGECSCNSRTTTVTRQVQRSWTDQKLQPSKPTRYQRECGPNGCRVVPIKYTVPLIEPMLPDRQNSDRGCRSRYDGGQLIFNDAPIM